MISDKIVVSYVAFLKNYKKVSEAMESYYSEPSGQKRARLVQELARLLYNNSKSFSARIIKAEKTMCLLDTYNKVKKIEHHEDLVNIDFDEAEISSILRKAGIRK